MSCEELHTVLRLWFNILYFNLLFIASFWIGCFCVILVVLQHMIFYKELISRPIFFPKFLIF